MRGLDRVIGGRIITREAEIVQRQPGLSGELRCKHSQLCKVRLHGLLRKLAELRIVAAFLVSRNGDHRAHGGFPFFHLFSVLAQSCYILLGEAEEFRADLRALDRAQRRTCQRHAGARDPGVPEGADRVRPVDNRHQERIAGLVLIRSVFLPPLIVNRLFRSEPGLHHRIVVFISAENGIAFIEQIRDRINLSGCIPAIDHLKAWKAIFIG